MSALETLLADVADRREAQETKARGGYRALVLRLADGVTTKDDTAAKVGELIERLGFDDQRLAADVARVERHRALAAQAKRLPEHEEASRVGRAEVEALRAAREEQERAMRAAEADARQRRDAAARSAGEAREALDIVLASTPAETRAAYDDASAAVSRAEGVAPWARSLADGRIAHPPELPAGVPEASSERVALAWAKVREAAGALREAEARTAGRLDGGAVGVVDAAQAVLDVARGEYLAAAEIVATEVEGALPALRQAKVEALAVVLAADLDVLGATEPTS